MGEQAKSIGDLGTNLVTWVGGNWPKLAGALIMLIVGFIIAGFVASVVSKILARSGTDKTLTQFLTKLTRWTILLAVIFSVMGVFGFKAGGLASVLAGATVAIGLAFQGSLSNFASGLMLLFFRPFSIGDFINVGGEYGTVEELGVFTTTMNTLDNRRIILPNSVIFGAKIENVTANSTRRVDINVGADYGASIAETRKVLESVIKSTPNVLAGQPNQIFLSDLGDSSINWQVRLWCNTEHYWDVWQAGTENIKVAMDSAGIGIPYPQMDVHMAKGPNS